MDGTDWPDVMDVGIYGYQEHSESDDVPKKDMESDPDRPDINVRAWGLVLLVSCAILLMAVLRTF